MISDRYAYPALIQNIYFNYGGQGVLHRSVLAKISEHYNHLENLGAYSHRANNWIEAEKDATRKLLGQLLNVSPQTITLTHNTTEGCNIALWSYPWRSGDHLLLSDCEHPGILGIVAQLVERFRISYSFFPLLEHSGCLDPEPIVSACQRGLQDNTRMVMLSHIAWNSGQILPLEAIGRLCQSRQIWVAIDAAQSVGMMPIDLGNLPIDFYAFTGHKWLCGPLGVGGLYTSPHVLPQAQATFVGWRGMRAGNTGTKFEVASSAYPLLGAWRLAIEQSKLWGSPCQRYALLQERSQRLWRELSVMPSIILLTSVPPQSGLVTFQVTHRSAAELSLQLETQYQIILRAIPSPSYLRASLSYFTTDDDITRLLAVLRQV